MRSEPDNLEEAAALLSDARTIALLGANPNPMRPAHYVPAYLHAQGYRILPVNPAHVGKTMFGEPVRATLAELDEPVDIVDVFRRAEALEGHLQDLLAMDPPPKVVWFQSGIFNPVAASILRAHGITVVQDRCTLADHRSAGLGPVAG